MRLKQSLQAQMFCLLGLYLATFALICFFCFNAKFGIGWEALLKSPVGERVEAIGDAINNQLTNSDPEDWTKVLQNFEKIYHVQFYVFDGSGKQIAGNPVKLPRKLHEEISIFAPSGPLMMPLPPSPQEFPSSEVHRFIGSKRLQNSVSFADSRFNKINSPFIHHVPPVFRHHKIRAHNRFIVHTLEPSHFWIGCKFLLDNPKLCHPIPGVLLASSDNLWSSNFLFDVHFVAGSAIVVILVTLVFWYPFIYSITCRLSEVAHATEQIAEGKFDTKLGVSGCDEISQLSEAVNLMADRLNNFVHGQRRFLGDIAHEMFSPLARLHAAVDLLDESPTEQEQVALISDIKEEVEEMNTLLHELLAYSKAGLQNKQPELSAVNLQIIICDVIARLGISNNVKIDVQNHLTVLADPLLLERSISNIIRNSVRYAGNADPIEVTASISGTLVSIVISDNGPGVAKEMIKQLGEPFFRPEPSRSRSSGGVGLGLAIVKSCIESCGGTVLLRNRHPRGFEVELRLKAA